MKSKHSLQEKLEAYAQQGYYPFHMPGHKRNTALCSMQNPYALDITEIDGFDNLHDAHGILQEAMEEAALLCNAGETFYLVNGSSSGICAAICACVKEGGKILMVRGAHKSAYHAVYLQNLHPVYLYPVKQDCGRGHSLCGGICIEELESALSAHPDIQVVFLVSPVYEGIATDIQAAALSVHRHGCLLIVDEAHGAHFGFSPEVPQSAIRLGADIVIQSVHKTLPAFTQTAILHIGRNSTGIDRERLRRYLSVFQSSSPSYVLMAGIQNSLRFAAGEEGKERFLILYKKIKQLQQQAEQLRFLHLYALSYAGEIKDPSKLVIFIDAATGKDGYWLYQEFLYQYKLQMEMATINYVLAMTSIADTDEGFKRLWNAMENIDRMLVKEANVPVQNICHIDTAIFYTKQPPVRMTIRQALNYPGRRCPLEQLPGCISAGYICLYPPGIPLIVPGEELPGELCSQLRYLMDIGATFTGIEDGCAWVVKK